MESTNSQKENTRVSGNAEKESTAPGELFVYKRRYLVAFAYICARVGGLLQALSTSPISEQLSKIYEVQPILANLPTLIFLLTGSVATFPAMYITDQWGVH